MSKRFVNPANFILPLNINGMDGRMLRLESQNRHNKREILFIYDRQANIEKWWGMTVALRKFANVTMVDLPGLGGMDSFYSIGLKPTLDNMADYLASFVRLKYKRKRLTIFGVGFGFSVVTRMLQRDKDLRHKINMLVCLNGYAHKDDFVIRGVDRLLIKLYSLAGSTKLLSSVVTAVAYNDLVLRLKYPLSKVERSRGGPSKEFIRQFKIDLESTMDYRTKMYLNLELLSLDNCQERLDNDLWHIYSTNSDQKLDNKLVDEHFKVAFSGYELLRAKVGKKMPLVMNDDKQAIKYLPAKLRRQLKSHA